MQDLKFERSQQTWRILFKDQNMASVMILVFKSQKMCT